MRIIQFLDGEGLCTLALVHDAKQVEKLNTCTSVYDLANEAIQRKVALNALIESLRSGEMLDYQTLVDEQRLLPPIAHPDPAHLLVSGTGLTHLGSADTRAAMHAKLQNSDASATDSMLMFKMGLEGGKPEAGKTGVQPEWFYKGDGNIIVNPDADIPMPEFALDGGEEPEIAGLYLISADGTPCRIGFALGNEFSDHKMERINYLYLAHSKLRRCAIGPELLIGDLPKSLKGKSRIYRDGKVVWEKEFLSGEDNMSHSIANLEFHHFKYDSFLSPGNVHVHFFGTGTLSFADGFQTREGDTFEIECGDFGRPLRNTLVTAKNPPSGKVKAL